MVAGEIIARSVRRSCCQVYYEDARQREWRRLAEAAAAKSHVSASVGLFHRSRDMVENWRSLSREYQDVDFHAPTASLGLCQASRELERLDHEHTGLSAELRLARQQRAMLQGEQERQAQHAAVRVLEAVLRRLADQAACRRRIFAGSRELLSQSTGREEQDGGDAQENADGDEGVVLRIHVLACELQWLKEHARCGPSHQAYVAAWLRVLHDEYRRYLALMAALMPAEDQAAGGSGGEGGERGGDGHESDTDTDSGDSEGSKSAVGFPRSQRRVITTVINRYSRDCARDDSLPAAPGSSTAEQRSLGHGTGVGVTAASFQSPYSCLPVPSRVRMRVVQSLLMSGVSLTCDASPNSGQGGPSSGGRGARAVQDGGKDMRAMRRRKIEHKLLRQLHHRRVCKSPNAAKAHRRTGASARAPTSRTDANNTREPLRDENDKAPLAAETQVDEIERGVEACAVVDVKQSRDDEVPMVGTAEATQAAAREDEAFGRTPMQDEAMGQECFDRQGRHDAPEQEGQAPKAASRHAGAVWRSSVSTHAAAVSATAGAPQSEDASNSPRRDSEPENAGTRNAPSRRKAGSKSSTARKREGLARIWAVYGPLPGTKRGAGTGVVAATAHLHVDSHVSARGVGAGPASRPRKVRRPLASCTSALDPRANALAPRPAASPPNSDETSPSRDAGADVCARLERVDTPSPRPTSGLCTCERDAVRSSFACEAFDEHDLGGAKLAASLRASSGTPETTLPCIQHAATRDNIRATSHTNVQTVVLPRESICHSVATATNAIEPAQFVDEPVAAQMSSKDSQNLDLPGSEGDAKSTAKSPIGDAAVGLVETCVCVCMCMCISPPCLRVYACVCARVCS